MKSSYGGGERAATGRKQSFIVRRKNSRLNNMQTQHKMKGMDLQRVSSHYNSIVDESVK